MAVLALIAALAASISSTGCSSKSDVAAPTASMTASNVMLTSDQRQHIHLQTIASSTFRKTIETTGTVDFDNDQATTVLAPMGGPVAKLIVALGRQVKTDDPLALVDSPDYATAVSTYRKAISTAKTARQIADLDKQLAEHHAIAQRDADQSELTAVSAEADRDAALQSLLSLKTDADSIKTIQEGRPLASVEGVIRSPVSGTVAEKLITPGQLLSAGATPCFTVADLSRMWVMAHVFGSDLTSIRIGDPVEVMTDVSSEIFTGAVDNVSAMVDPDTRSVAVRVVVNNPGEYLKKGMYARVRIRSRQDSTGLLLPASAILRNEENEPFVYLAQSNGSFARRLVTLGYRVRDQYELTTGLAAGDQAVVEGALFMQFLQNQ